jgi:hypothetical protein
MEQLGVVCACFQRWLSPIMTLYNLWLHSSAYCTIYNLLLDSLSQYAILGCNFLFTMYNLWLDFVTYVQYKIYGWTPLLTVLYNIQSDAGLLYTICILWLELSTYNVQSVLDSITYNIKCMRDSSTTVLQYIQSVAGLLLQYEIYGWTPLLYLQYVIHLYMAGLL